MGRSAIALLLVLGCGQKEAPLDATSCLTHEEPEPEYIHLIAPGGNFAGTACLSCHRDPAAGVFDFAGTVMDSSNAPEAGVHIRLRDSQDRLMAVTTDAAGNFFVPENSGMVFPVFVDASDCPTVIRMGGQLLDASQGNCNTCHDGGVQPRINLDR